MQFSIQHTAAVAAASVAAAALLVSAPAAQAQNMAALQARHEALKPAMAASAFKRPLVLESVDSPAQPHGDVYAVINHPFRAVGAALQQPGNWCSILLLQSNIKRCVPEGAGAAGVNTATAATAGATAGGSTGGDTATTAAATQATTLNVAVGRKFDQPAQDAYQVAFKFNAGVSGGNYLSVQMTAATGPVGTRDYRLALEAVPIDDKRSLIHMSYAYANGVAARMATDAYLATAGRGKVGFSVLRNGEDGQQVLVDGIRGVAERNTMRYFLAIETFLAAPGEQQAEQRFRDWFAATERYPRQLHEMDLDQYLASKRRGDS